MSAPSALAPILGHLRAEPSRTWSVIVTLYGDAVLPRGGALWLGTVLEIFAALEIGGNVVRTAMSRLAADGWLARTRVGRNAFYRLAAKGRATFTEAAARIYRAEPPAWDGTFRIAVLDPASDAARPTLEGAGFVALAPGVLVGTNPPPCPSPRAILLAAHAGPEDARRLARQAWPWERLQAGYGRFVAAFTPLRDAVAAGETLSDLDALVARLLLVHEYRRQVLHDPLLPDALLPEDWPGRAARALCAALYPLLLAGSERWLDAHGLTVNGKLPPADASLAARFGSEAHITKND